MSDMLLIDSQPMEFEASWPLPVSPAIPPQAAEPKSFQIPGLSKLKACHGAMAWLYGGTIEFSQDRRLPFFP
jgi:hypothetical protein